MFLHEPRTSRTYMGICWAFIQKKNNARSAISVLTIVQGVALSLSWSNQASPVLLFAPSGASAPFVKCHRCREANGDQLRSKEALAERLCLFLFLQEITKEKQVEYICKATWLSGGLGIGKTRELPSCTVMFSADDIWNELEICFCAGKISQNGLG